MKITGVETIGLHEFPNLLWVQVHTDEGLTGLGETFFGSQAVAAWIHESAAPGLLGEDALAIERHWQALVGFIGGTGTGVENRGRSAIDIALWDILGQASGQPLYQLWGGAVRDRIPVYNTCAGYDYTRKRPRHARLPVENWGMGHRAGPYEDLEGFLHHADELARNLVEEGYLGMKIWPLDLYADQFGGHTLPGATLKRALEPFEKIRRAVGDDIEMHAKWDLPAAKVIAKALEPYRPYWFEDPIAARSCTALADFAQSTWVATAASETLGTRWGYRALLDHNAADVVIFDPTWTGGGFGSPAHSGARRDVRASGGGSRLRGTGRLGVGQLPRHARAQLGHPRSGAGILLWMVSGPGDHIAPAQAGVSVSVDRTRSGPTIAARRAHQVRL